MTIRELWTSLNRVTRDISSWVYSPIPKIIRISENLGHRIADADNPFKKNHDNSHDSSNINSNNTEERQYLETSSSSNRPETRNNSNHINNGNLITSGVNVNSRKYSSSSYNSHLWQEHKEDFTPLHPKKELQGRLKKYVVEELTKEENKQAKCRYYEYRGRIEDDKQLVKIKEYLFIDSLLQKNQSEFIERANIKLKLQADFRLITPSDTFRDKNKNRCYIITQLNKNYITLRDYLKTKGSMSDREVKNLLEQVLQSLYCLHSQNIMLGNQIKRALAHGNINIDSLLIEDRGGKFFVYLSDFAIWEDIVKYQNFIETNSYINNNKFQHDLRDLGDVALRALFWNQVGYNNFNLNNSNIIQDFISKRNDGGLIGFIFKLREANGKFNNIEEALKEFKNINFKKLKSEAQSKYQQSGLLKQSQTKEAQEQSNQNDSTKHSNLWKNILLFLPIIATLIIGLYLFINREGLENSESGSTTNTSESSKSSIKIEPFSSKIIIDELVSDWINKASFASHDKYFSIKTLLLDKYKVKIEATENKTNKILNEITETNSKFDFAIVSLPILEKTTQSSDNKECKAYFLQEHPNFACQIIAYDGIVFFVPFSDTYGDKSVLKLWNGKIDKDKLANLYQGKEQNIEIYKSEEKQLEDLFIKELGKKDFTISPYVKSIKKLEFNQKLQNIRNDFEIKGKNIIGFGLLSKLYGQCSVYPLAVKGIQPLSKNNDDPINPKLDLCNDKGSYRPNYKRFRHDSNLEKYPFRFAIAVIYPQQQNINGKRFADMMLTHERQTRLKEVGLVPAKDIKS